MATAVDLGSTNNTLTFGDDDYNVTGTDGSNTLTLGNGTDTVTLGNGNNTLTLANGTDQIVLGVGNNTVTTGSGTDTISATDGNNTVTVGDGNDSVTLGNGSDSVTSGNGNSTITVGNGVDDNITVGNGSNALFLGSGTGGVVNTQAGGNTLSIAAGSLAGDTIQGNLSSTGVTPNTLTLTTAGTADAANVSGFGVYRLATAGATTLGLTDANFARVPGASIKVVEVSGGSTIDASAVSAANSVSVYLGSGSNIATGGAGADFFYGAPGEQSVVNGGAGYDSMIFSGPQSDYTITMTNGVITVVGDGENDTLTSIENILFNGNVTAALTSDTGPSNTDGITSNDALNGTAEAGTIVSITEGNVLLGTTTADANGAWVFTPTGLADGSHTVTASQTNPAGITNNASVGFTLNTAVPALTAGLANDTGSSATDGVTSDDTLTGTAAAGSTVTILNGTAALGTTVAAADGSWTYAPTGLADGAYTLTASDTNVAGNAGTASVGFTLDTTAPGLSVVLQDDTGASATDGITNDRAIVGTADGPGQIVISVNGQVVESFLSPGGQQTFTPASRADGTYQIVVSDTDSAGNTSTATLNATLDTVAPVVTATLANDSGAPGSNGVTNNPSLAGTGEANGTLTILNGTTVLGTTTVGTDGNWNYTPTGLADGNYSLTASETDTAGNTGTATVGFTLNSAVPTVTAMLVNHDGSVSSNDVTLAGTAQGNSVVTIANGGTAIATVVADANGNWNYTTDSLADGTYALTASQTDAAGNTGTAVVAVTLNHVYTANDDNIDNTSNVFIVLDKPGQTANIDLTNNTQAVTVFGGGANMNLTAGNALVVMNGPGQTNATTIHSLGNDFIWGGQSTINMDGVSGNQMVLSGTGPTSGTLNLNTSGPAFNLLDVGGTTGTTETINNLGSSATEIFGGKSDIAFTGGNSLIIVNGSDQTGNLTVQSTGGNTVWTGSSTTTFNEGTSGDDTVVLSGSGRTVVHGTAAPSTGTTTIADDKGTGQFEYDGGTKAVSMSIGAEHATVFGGTGSQTMNLNGSGSLIVADPDTVSGLQTVAVAPGSTGYLEFWGGYGSNDTSITLGAGSAFIQAGSGNDTLTGGSGNFSLSLAASVNTLVNIDGSKSGAVSIMGYTGSNANMNVTNIDSQAVVGGSLVLHLHDGSSVTFQSYVPDATHVSGAVVG